MRQFLRILEYAKPYLFKLIIGFVLVVIVGQSPLFMPLVQKFVIDDILFHSKSQSGQEGARRFQRARCPKRLPVVLSRQEVQALLSAMDGRKD